MSGICGDTNLSIQAENYLWRVSSRFLPGYQGVHGNCPGFALGSDKGVLLVALLCFVCQYSLFMVLSDKSVLLKESLTPRNNIHKPHFYRVLN